MSKTPAHQDPAKKTRPGEALKQLQEVFGPILKERDASFATLPERLADTVSTLKVTTTAVPVQLEGQLQSGELYYFRARGQSASLSLWRGVAKMEDVDKERYWSPDASAEAERWDWPEAGWLEADEVEAVFRELLREALSKLPAEST